jgi:hypothetical protein
MFLQYFFGSVLKHPAPAASDYILAFLLRIIYLPLPREYFFFSIYRPSLHPSKYDMRHDQRTSKSIIFIFLKKEVNLRNFKNQN